MPKKACYFKCKYDGLLHCFPPVTYNSYEKYYKWKDILRKKDKEKDDYFIIHNFKLCSNHFEKYYIAANNRLTKHAVPTLKLGITLKQEELLCSFIEENSELIMKNDVNGPMLGEVIAKWETRAPQLNAVGPKRSCSAWAEYLCDIMSSLKTKKVIWSKETSTAEADVQVIKNTDDFTELELKILELWHKGITTQDSPDHLESTFTDENEVDMEYLIEVRDGDNSRDSDFTIRYNEPCNEIVTFTLNVATGGQKPLLQAADIAPYEAPQDSNVKCNCKHSDDEVQDEFDAFGKDIAQQLRSMPPQTALETKKLLMTVLRSKQSKILNDSFLQY